ncbi:MAG: AMIN domain-containing protein [Sedimenticola sp.]
MALLAVLASAALLWRPPGLTAEISHVDSTRSGDELKITFHLQGESGYHHFTLDNPHRLVIDLETAVVGENLNHLQLQQPPLKRIRYGTQSDGRLRLVFDLENEIRQPALVMNKAGEDRHLLTVSLKSNQAPPQASISPPPPPIPPPVDGVDIRMDESMADGYGTAGNAQPVGDGDSPAVADTSVPLPTFTVDEQGEHKAHESMKSGTLGVQKYPKSSYKRSTRYDLGYKTSVGSVDMGVSIVKPQIFMQKKFDSTDVKLLLEEDGDASLGVIYNW